MSFKAARQIDFPSRNKHSNTKKKENKKEFNGPKQKLLKDKQKQKHKIHTDRTNKNKCNYLYSTPIFRDGKQMMSKYDDYVKYNQQFMGTSEYNRVLLDDYREIVYYESIYNKQEDVEIQNRDYSSDEKEDLEDEQIRQNYDENMLYELLNPPYKKYNSTESFNMSCENRDYSSDEDLEDEQIRQKYDENMLYELLNTGYKTYNSTDTESFNVL